MIRMRRCETRTSETNRKYTRYGIERHRTGCEARAAGRQRRGSRGRATEPVRYDTYKKKVRFNSQERGYRNSGRAPGGVRNEAAAARARGATGDVTGGGALRV